MFGAVWLNPSCSSHSPSCTGATDWTSICKDNGMFCLVHHFNQKAVWCPGVAPLGQRWRDTYFCTCFQKIFFFLCSWCHLGSDNMKNSPWLPTEAPWLGHCPCVPRGSVLLFLHQTIPSFHTQLPRLFHQASSSFSHAHPQRLCFPLQLFALCLPIHSPTASLHPRVQG